MDTNKIKNYILAVLALYFCISLYFLISGSNKYKSSNELVEYLKTDRQKYKDSLSVYKVKIKEQDIVIQKQTDDLNKQLEYVASSKTKINNINNKNDEKITVIKHMSVDESIDFFSKWTK